MKKLLLNVFLFLTSVCFGQMDMKIYKKNGQVESVSVSQVDSVKYSTSSPIMMNVYKNNNTSMLSVSINDIDSIKYVTNSISVASITGLDCANANTIGILTKGIPVSDVSTTLAYTGGNGGVYTKQTIFSKGVEGLTATLQSNTLAKGNGNLVFEISGTPVSAGKASFEVNLGGQTCTFTVEVGFPPAKVSSIECNSANTTGKLTEGTVAFGVHTSLVYNGGNEGIYDKQTISSTGVLGLTATLSANSLAFGRGYLEFDITGTPASSGTASFGISLGGQSCSFTITVNQKTQTNGYGDNISDVDGNTYKTVYIGTQQWMAENLKTSKYNDGSAIPNVTDNTEWSKLSTGAWAYYDNDAINNANYGKLYNWYTLSPTTNGNKNVCPTGWHIPTFADWTVLTDFLGGIGAAGGKMKEEGTTNWNTPNIDATNSSLFTGLPGGYRFIDGSFNGKSVTGYWWSSSQGTTKAWGFSLGQTSGVVDGGYYFGKVDGFSVRCLKD